MKLLHIGKPGCLQRYTEPTAFTQSVACVDLPGGLSDAEYAAAAPDAEVLIADAVTPVSAALIAALPRLKLIHSEGVAYNRIDLQAAAARGVYVCNCAGMNAQAVAEQTILLMLGVLHSVAANDRAVREGRQIAVKEGYMADGSLLDLADCKVGLIGLGNIGRRTAELLHAFGAQTFYTQRHRLSEAAEQACGAVWCPDTGELLRRCNMVSLHVPVTPQTEKMCGDAFFAQMQPGSYFINTSRGELVDDAALLRALASGRVTMAGLDTLDDEPVQPSHILLNQPEAIAQKLLFSPHIGGITGSSFRRGYRILWANIARVAQGQAPVNVVNGVAAP